MLASCPSQKQTDHCVDNDRGLMALFSNMRNLVQHSKVRLGALFVKRQYSGSCSRRPGTSTFPARMQSVYSRSQTESLWAGQNEFVWS